MHEAKSQASHGQSFSGYVLGSPGDLVWFRGQELCQITVHDFSAGPGGLVGRGVGETRAGGRGLGRRTLKTFLHPHTVTHMQILVPLAPASFYGCE